MKKSKLILLGALVFVMVMILVGVLEIRKNINHSNKSNCNSGIENINSQTIVQPAYNPHHSIFSA